MTLEEAIKHCEEVACKNECKMTSDDGYTDVSMKQCAEEHRQLAEWLKELKQLREQTTWIPVSERLPKEGGDYLTTVSFDIGAKEPVREVYKDYFCILSQKWLNRDEDVVAWMPSPESYKVESE